MLEFGVPVRGEPVAMETMMFCFRMNIFFLISIESFQVPFQPKAIQAGMKLSPGRGTEIVHLLEKTDHEHNIEGEKVVNVIL